VGWATCAVLVLGVGGCYQSHAEVGDGDADADADAGICAGGWYDPATGLCWQDPPEEIRRDRDRAVGYCNGLSLGGAGPGAWHLPTIDELRSLVRGCPAVGTGGPCGITDSCLRFECWTDGCQGCVHTPGGGPGTGGAYWPPELGGTADWYWSSSLYVDAGGYGYYLQFEYGVVSSHATWAEAFARCVRPGP